MHHHTTGGTPPQPPTVLQLCPSATFVLAPKNTLKAALIATTSSIPPPKSSPSRSRNTMYRTREEDILHHLWRSFLDKGLLQHYGFTRRQNSEKDKSVAPTLHVIHLASWTLSHVREYSASGHQVVVAFLSALENKTRKRQK
ncbi:hypothetical protein V6N13_124776 [Hibiscus sabdariffa]